jgi:hypothetical protein
VHDFDDARQLGDGVSTEGLLAQRGDQPLLTPYAVEIPAGGPPVTGVG